MSSSERPEKRKRIKSEAPDEVDFERSNASRRNASRRDPEQERRPIATNDRLELATLCQKYGLKMIQRRADTIGPKDSKRFRQELQLVGGFVGRDCPIFVSSAHSKIWLAEDECAREALSWLTVISSVSISPQGTSIDSGSRRIGSKAFHPAGHSETKRRSSIISDSRSSGSWLERMWILLLLRNTDSFSTSKMKRYSSKLGLIFGR
jgi:hypothetical protein